MGSFLDELEIERDNPYTIWCDNNSTIDLTKSTKGHGKSKHFALDYHWIWEAVQLRDLNIKYIPSEDNLADIFTKDHPQASCNGSLMTYGGSLGV